jgi:molybdopterin synthase sulfur carrier subunit
MMTIRVKYFASLRERMGRAEETLSADEALTVADVWRRVSGAQPVPPNLLAAVNQEYGSFSQAVHDGDEVAFFPPVTGG